VVHTLTAGVLRGLFQEVRYFRATIDDLVAIYLTLHAQTGEVIYSGSQEDVRRALLDDLNQLLQTERLVLDEFGHYHLPAKTTKPPTSRTSDMVLMTGLYAKLVAIGQEHLIAKRR
jgi:hypothetical protein